MSTQFSGDKLSKGYSAVFTAMAYGNENGVNSGCAATTGTSLNVNVSAGQVFFSTSQVDVAADVMILDTNTTAFTRADIIVVNSSGVISVVKGTPSAIQATPSFDANNFIVLAVVEVRSNNFSLLSSDIIDARILNVAGGANGTSFTGLSDTPSNLISGADKNVSINASGTALIYTDKPEIVYSAPYGRIEMYALSLNGAVTIATLRANGYAICDGTSSVSQGITSPIVASTPNMVDRFIRMSDDETSGTTGGSETHTHTVAVDQAEDTEDGSGGTDAARRTTYDTSSASNLPPYYEVAFFVKVK